MSIVTTSTLLEMLESSAMSVPTNMFDGHDEGLCHDHHWARDVAAERRSYPRVADAARAATPSSALHDDIHYAS